MGEIKVNLVRTCQTRRIYIWKDNNMDIQIGIWRTAREYFTPTCYYLFYQLLIGCKINPLWRLNYLYLCLYTVVSMLVCQRRTPQVRHCCRVPEDSVCAKRNPNLNGDRFNKTECTISYPILGVIWWIVFIHIWMSSLPDTPSAIVCRPISHSFCWCLCANVGAHISDVGQRLSQRHYPLASR